MQHGIRVPLSLYFLSRGLSTRQPLVFKLFRGRSLGFSPRRGDSLHLSIGLPQVLEYSIQSIVIGAGMGYWPETANFTNFWNKIASDIYLAWFLWNLQNFSVIPCCFVFLNSGEFAQQSTKVAEFYQARMDVFPQKFQGSLVAKIWFEKIIEVQKWYTDFLCHRTVSIVGLGLRIPPGNEKLLFMLCHKGRPG